jgi:hypothetical protein
MLDQFHITAGVYYSATFMEAQACGTTLCCDSSPNRHAPPDTPARSVIR